MSERKLVAKWHSFYFDQRRDDKGVWIRITETRPSGHRQSILIDQAFAEAFSCELLKAVSELGAAEVEVASEPVRAYGEWSPEEDQVLFFLRKIGNSVAEIAGILQREKGAIRSRLRKLEEQE